MTKPFVHSRLTFSLAAATLLLAACGGGGGSAPPADPPVAGTDVPTSATTSAPGALAFANQLASTPDNTGEPRVLGDARLATSETDEPDASI